ncbi:hypothetical protein FQN51_001305 [Onygenales sp. PD_10]|nr:hypothetical protein FQN51_001305 [Onygenales sp. PD_10]
MLSQFVTAARGLFARQDPALEDASTPEQAQTQQQTPGNKGSSSSKRQSKTASNMVSATRRTVFGADAVDSSPITRSAAASGKRKIGSSSKGEADSQAPKRRKKRASNVASLPASGDEEEEKSPAVKKLPIRTVDTPEKTPNGQLDSPVSEVKQSEEGSESNAKSTHMRFGSEEPEAEVNGDRKEETPVEEAPKEIMETEDEDSDDEAPETVDNAAQLRKLKEAAKKEEQAKQRAQALNKEKRRERDQRLKSQAASKPVLPKVIPDTLPKPDEIRSESSTTLQGSTTREPNFSSLRSLPTLLPDEILNAEPSVRPPTPPYESESLVGKVSQKRKFLDKVEKKPKDIRVGGTHIRVLDSPHNGLGASRLPPKASKASRKARENWMASNRNLPSGGNLRRTTAGSSGFLRK